MLSFIESGTPGYFHASASNLDCIDRVQRRFLREVGLTEEQALLDYRLAPLKMRRCMGILGLLHRVSLGMVPKQVAELFPRAPLIAIPDAASSRVRGGISARHNRQLFDRIVASSTDALRRSIFGMVQCYNALPQFVVDQPNICCVQRALQTAVSRQAFIGSTSWQDVFSDGRRYASFLRFQSLFHGQV